MNKEQTIPDTLLHLYIDGELDPTENQRVLDAIENDTRVRTRVCQLQHLKALVKNHYPLDARPQRTDPRSSPARRWQSAIAASLLLCIGIVLGWLGHGLKTSGQAVSSFTQEQAAHPVAGSRILLHIDDSDRSKLQALLAYTEALLQHNETQGLKIEVIANAGGLDIFRSNGSPEQRRLKKLTSQHSNVQLFACARALAQLRAKGVEIDLIPEVHTESTALDHIIRRMNEGWRYHKI